MRRLSDEEFAHLLAFRTGLRRFQHWSESQARTVGLTAAQHQLLLAIKGHADTRGPTVGEVADHLLLRHHSAVELANRAETAGYVARHKDDEDARIVRLRLTALGEERIGQLGELHLAELTRLAPLFDQLVDGLEPVSTR